MNKRVAKPKDDEPLPPDDDVAAALTEQYLRDHHDEIAEKLRAAKAEMDSGKGEPMGSLEKVLSDAREYAKRRR